MTLEEIAKQSSDDKEEEQEDEEAKKSFDQSLIETLSTLTMRRRYTGKYTGIDQKECAGRI